MFQVRSKSGAPVSSDFAESRGTPIVADRTATTGRLYFLDDGGNMREVGDYGTNEHLTGTLTVDTLINNVGGQIKFPATQIPSADANTLDDYEEGTWVPVDASGASLSFTSVSGSYTKIGRLVTVNGALTYPATVNGSAAVVGGLPFTVGKRGHGGALSTNGTALAPIALAATTTVALYNPAGPVALTNANMTGAALTFTLAYEV